MSEPESSEDRGYWRANNRLIISLLAVWALVSFGGGILFVEALNRYTFFGLPFGFWIAHQGSIYVFVILVFIYAWAMDWLDKRYHKDNGRS